MGKYILCRGRDCHTVNETASGRIVWNVRVFKVDVETVVSGVTLLIQSIIMLKTLLFPSPCAGLSSFWIQGDRLTTSLYPIVLKYGGTLDAA